MKEHPVNFNPRQYMQSRDFEAFYYNDSYLKDVALHHHDFYEMYFFIGGTVSYIVESRSYTLQTGDIMLISPTELHQPVFGNHPLGYTRIVIWISRDYLFSLDESGALASCFAPDSENHRNLLRLDVKTQSRLFDLALDVANELSSENDVYGRTMAAAKLNELLVSLNRIKRDSKGATEPDGSMQTTLTGVIEYINDNITQPLSLDYLADKFYVSKYHLIRKFKDEVGTSVHRYITQRRLIFAKQLMLEGVPPSECPTRVGFSDYSSFFRAFKAEYGISPKEFCKKQG